jgi:hypothetical protein
MVASKQLRRSGVLDDASMHLEDAVGGEKPQDSAKRIGLGAHGCRKVGGASMGLPNLIGDTEVGDYMQAA